MSSITKRKCLDCKHITTKKWIAKCPECGSDDLVWTDRR